MVLKVDLLLLIHNDLLPPSLAGFSSAAEFDLK